MTLHIAHESNKPANDGKVPGPVTVQVQDVLPLSPSLYRPEIDIIRRPTQVETQDRFSTFATAGLTLPRVHP
jgi:hypothetical protein